jgi:hypothetical protein
MVVAIELTANAKTLVPKTSLATFSPDLCYRLNPIGLDTLRHWLSVRYKRAAFPDEFDRRMGEVTHLAERLEKIVRAVDPVISAVYFRLDILVELSSEDSTPYGLEIFLVYEPGMDPAQNGDRADEAAEAVNESFRRKCFSEKEKSWKHIKLVNVITVSEDDLTVSQAKRLQQWRLEHLSLRPDSESAVPLDLRA